MRYFQSLLMISSAALLSACAQYTEKTSPCFDQNGDPVVTRAAISFAATAPVSTTIGKGCTFEALPLSE
tara:strand:- start:379 stop:585 length:207 start_codon:yes stop_codon:yes gene_type:complete